MLKKSPLCPRERVDCAMDPAPNRTRMYVPENIRISSFYHPQYLPIVSARNSLTHGLWIRKLQPVLFFAIVSQCIRSLSHSCVCGVAWLTFGALPQLSGL